jgi:hypothetical protein
MLIDQFTQIEKPVVVISLDENGFSIAQKIMQAWMRIGFKFVADEYLKRLCEIPYEQARQFSSQYINQPLILEENPSRWRYTSYHKVRNHRTEFIRTDGIRILSEGIWSLNSDEINKPVYHMIEENGVIHRFDSPETFKYWMDNFYGKSVENYN